MADQKITALTATTTLADTDLLPVAFNVASTPVTRKITWANIKTLLSAVFASSTPATPTEINTGSDNAKIVTALGLMTSKYALKQICQGRLTLTTGVPVTTSDVTGATTMRFTPYKGDLISLFDGTNWGLYSFTERSLALGTLTANIPYDVFIYNNAGTLTLEFTAWTNVTTRATALTTQDGVLVKTGATTRRYLGTFYTTSTTTTEDSATYRGVFNYYNRVMRFAQCSEPTNSWADTSTSFREANSGTTFGTSRVGIMTGYSEESADAIAVSLASTSSGNIAFSSGVGVNSTTVNSALMHGAMIPNPTATLVSTHAFYKGILPVGFNTISWLELGGANLTMYGDNNTTTLQAGMVVSVLM